MEFTAFQSILNQLKKVITASRLFSIARTILLFFSADYFFKFQSNWYDFNLTDVDSRSIDLLIFISIYGIIWFLFYRVLKFFLRLFFHGYVKSRVFRTTQKIKDESNFKSKKEFLEFLKIFSALIHRFAFRLGFITSNDLNVPINIDITDKEELFNEVMDTFYRWISTIIHTILVVFIVWKYYSTWLLIFFLVVLIVSVVLAWVLMFVILNINVVELFRIKLLEDNNKYWSQENELKALK